jgi:peroxiredoxin/predicted 2-oxoglutarate/Fe(II)-dependent dioxygenase YbiX
MTQTLPPTPRVGDRVPPFSLPASSGASMGLNDLVGRPFLLVFFSPGHPTTPGPALADFGQHAQQFKELGIQLVGVGSQSPEELKALADQPHLTFPLLSDASGQVSAMLGAGSGNGIRKALLVEPGTHVLAEYLPLFNSNLAQNILSDALRLLQREPSRLLVQHAPVLLIPNALPQEVCQRLMHAWETEGNEEFGSVRKIEGQAVRVVDHSHKIRRDHYLKAGSELESVVKFHLSRRVIPEINFAYHFQVTRSEGMRVGCYDAKPGGYFRAHRDNSTPATAYRRFAMSLLLNDDYQGGDLRFPEFGPHHYRPDAGAAIIFSCSLLHEATDVTAGRRFVLIDFFYGEAEARMREAYARQTGDGYRGAPAGR